MRIAWRAGAPRATRRGRARRARSQRPRRARSTGTCACEPGRDRAELRPSRLVSRWGEASRLRAGARRVRAVLGGCHTECIRSRAEWVGPGRRDSGVLHTLCDQRRVSRILLRLQQYGSGCGRAGEQRQENERDASPRRCSPVAVRPFDPAERERRAHRGRDDHDPNFAGCTENDRPDHHAGDSGEKERGPARVCEDHGDHRAPGCEGCRAGGRPIGRAGPDVRELRPAQHKASDDANRHLRHPARRK